MRFLLFIVFVDGSHKIRQNIFIGDTKFQTNTRQAIFTTVKFKGEIGSMIRQIYPMMIISWIKLRI